MFCKHCAETHSSETMIEVQHLNHVALRWLYPGNITTTYDATYERLKN